MSSFNWTCPFCNHDVTIVSANFSESGHALTIENRDGEKIIYTGFIVCPNKKCKRYTLRASLYHWLHSAQTGWYQGDLIKSWNLVPQSMAKVFPDYIPEQMRQDYEEACSILDLSPKASATLSRRCLQGIIRDFWKIVRDRLIDEIDAIEDKCDPLTWKAIDCVRKIGNIGAHMEKDVNLIIDVDPEEARLLIGLIETLLHDWYISKHEKEERLKKIVEVSEKKENQRKSAKKGDN